MHIVETRDAVQLVRAVGDPLNPARAAEACRVIERWLQEGEAGRLKMATESLDLLTAALGCAQKRSASTCSVANSVRWLLLRTDTHGRRMEPRSLGPRCGRE